MIRILLLLLIACYAQGAANGKLQLHFMNVGQGDGAVLISPQGEVVLFDTGVRNDCDRPLSYLQQLGISKVDYLIVSHYHDDHIGCAVAVLQEFPLKSYSFDRGSTYRSKTYSNYVAFVGQKRQTAIEGSALNLDTNAATPVKIEFVAMNGNGVQTKDENDRSLVCVVRHGQFDAVIGGDLSGYTTSKYRDIETSVAPKVGQVELYKANHHGSQYSSNPSWLTKIRPRVAIISCGNGNEYHHPTPQAMDRIHQENVVAYWTERGNGAVPGPMDKVGGNIIVEVSTNTASFTVRYQWDKLDTYSVWNAHTPGGTATIQQFAWSSKADKYHLASCKYVKNIDPQNLKTGTQPPEGKEFHLGCPK